MAAAELPPLMRTDLPFPCRRGKVRDCYQIGSDLLLVSTDRISAFDWVLPSGIPDKGRVLTQMSLFWFRWLGVPNHLIDDRLPDEVRQHDPNGELEGRSVLVKAAEVVPFECVVRGYLEGSGWRDYQRTGHVCGWRLPEGLLQCQQLPEPLFTPATKADQGHDENVSLAYMRQQLSEELAEELVERSLDIYRRGAAYAAERGIVIADTKFEFGLHRGELLLIDEVLTPDSSRFWPADSYQAGHPQPSFDKQFVREYLMGTTWDRNSPPPPLPPEVVAQTRAKYIEAYERLTGSDFASTQSTLGAG